MSRELFLLIVGVVMLAVGMWIGYETGDEHGGCLSTVGLVVAVYALASLVWGYATTLPSAFGGK